MKIQKNRTIAAIFLAVEMLAWAHVQAQTVVPITGGDPGHGFAPLPEYVDGVDFGSSAVTIQGVTFNSGSATFNNSDGGVAGTYGGYSEAFSFSPSDANNTAMASMLDAFEFAAAGQYGSIGPGDSYAQFQFTGLIAGLTYQVDVFTVADQNPRYTLIQVVGATTNLYNVNTTTSPQDVVFDMTPDASGNITVQWAWGTGAWVVGTTGNSGLVSGIALTSQPVAPPTLSAKLVTDGQVQLSWPVTSVPYNLWSSSNVAGPFIYTGMPVTTNQSVQPSVVTAIDTIGGAAKFYRLQMSSGMPLIPVVSAQSDPDGATLQMNPGMMKIQVFSPSIVRVAYSATNTIPSWSNSFAVITAPSTNNWPLTMTPIDLHLDTGLLEVRVNRASGAVGFYDTNGSPLLLEPDDGGKSLVPTTAGGVVTLKSQQNFLMSSDEAFYGLGQHQSGVMDYANSTVHLQQRNPGESDVPVLVSSHGYGILWDNPSITDVNFGVNGSHEETWISQAADSINYYFMYGPEPDAVIADYRHLTGEAPMFGQWAWGYWQSKNAYNSQAQLISVENQYRTSNIPIDGIVQDWHYWNPNPWGSDIFNSASYSNVAQLMQILHSNNIHMIISKWARFDIGAYTNYVQLSNAGALYPELINGTPNAQYYDAFNPAGRRIYWQQISNDLFSLGMDGWWLDASEPELNGNWGEYANYTTAAGSGAAVYNAYPLMHTTAVYQGQRGSSSSKRVFILTRSAYAGQQRNAAVTWSGDIASTWASFAVQISAGLNFSISGIPYWNTDIGGYQDDNGLGDPTSPAYDELFTRWFQYGAFCPMFRVHGQNFGKEMWQFPTNTEAILINFDELRYHLLPYIYSVSWMVTSQGYSMMRPLVMDFDQDTNVYTIPDQYMFGPALMACPVTTAGATNRDVYLPSGTTWYDFWTGQTYAGGQTISAPAPIQTMPIYARAGSIIPYGPEIQYATETNNPLELRVYRDADGAFTLYEDEGDNYDYETGAYATIPISWNESTQTLTIGQCQGSFPGMLTNRTFNIVWVSPGHGVGVPSTGTPDVTVSYSGQALAIPVGH